MKESAKILKVTCVRRGKIVAGVVALLFAMVLAASQALAINFETGNPAISSATDLQVRSTK